jgi:hypothetical protein
MAAPAPLGPADLPYVFSVLTGSLSHNPTAQKQAEAALQQLEARPGFCSCLAVRAGWLVVCVCGVCVYVWWGSGWGWGWGGQGRPSSCSRSCPHSRRQRASAQPRR